MDKLTPNNTDSYRIASDGIEARVLPKQPPLLKPNIRANYRRNSIQTYGTTNFTEIDPAIPTISQEKIPNPEETG